MTDAAVMEGLHDPVHCEGCGRTPALYCYAWLLSLCEMCRWSRAERELQDGGRHPCRDNCSCQACWARRIAATSIATATEVTFTLVSGGPVP